MTPESVLSTINAGFACLTELLKFLQSENGQKLVAQAIADRGSWDAFWAQAASGVKRFFSGDLFRA